METLRKGSPQPTTHVGESIPEEHSLTRKSQFTYARDTAAGLAVSAETATAIAATTVEDNGYAR